MAKGHAKRRKRNTKKLTLKNAAKAIAKLISHREEERDRDLAEFERALRKKLKRFRPTKRRT